ncbi:PQQ-binding-like beta-propeller repeat protein [Streptomyces sp. NPDC059398]|uniref:outer membrane protein assembly factor BamB family protein n=1 Tax=Streptomyces sp. NPDC059398 TaxID=3346820 RepID=UPI0036B62651
MKERLDGWTWNSGDDNKEAASGPPAHDRYAVPRIRRTPAQSARAAGGWIRGRWIRLTTVVTVLALAIGGWQTYTYLTRYHEQISGTHGAFPTALGTAAPERPGRVLPSGGDASPVVVDGLALHERNDGITADNVRTGRTYWQYGREKAALISESVVGGGAVVLWYDDGLAVSVDLRSGKPGWHTKVAGKVREDSQDRVWRAGGTVVINQQDRLTGLSARNGKKLWSLAPPRGCERWDYRPPVDLADTEAFDARHCSGSEDGLYGLDPANGRSRWHLRDPYLDYGRLGDHTLVTLTPVGSLVTVDVSGSQPRVHSAFLSHHLYLRSVSDGMVILGSDDDTTFTARRVSDDSSSKVLWTVKAKKGYALGFPRTSDGRTYIPQYRPPLEAKQQKAPGSAQLLVRDARTGRELHRAELPASLYTSAEDLAGSRMAVIGAQYGVVRVGWAGFLVSPENQVTLADQEVPSG